MSNEVKYKVIKKCGSIKRGANTTIELNIIKWEDMEPKYDLRKWKDGKPAKGMTLDDFEISELFKLLQEEINTMNKIIPNENISPDDKLPF